MIRVNRKFVGGPRDGEEGPVEADILSLYFAVETGTPAQMSSIPLYKPIPVHVYSLLTDGNFHYMGWEEQ